MISNTNQLKAITDFLERIMIDFSVPMPKGGYTISGKTWNISGNGNNYFSYGGVVGITTGTGINIPTLGQNLNPNAGSNIQQINTNNTSGAYYKLYQNKKKFGDDWLGSSGSSA